MMRNDNVGWRQFTNYDVHMYSIQMVGGCHCSGYAKGRLVLTAESENLNNTLNRFLAVQL